MANKLTIYRGITFSNSFEAVSVNPATLAESPVNLAGKTVVFEMKKGFAAAFVLTSTAAAPTALGSRLSVTGAPLGQFTVKITDEESLTAKLGIYHWTVYTIDALGDNFLLGSGDMEVLER